jgi:hypothetical protein
MKAILLGCPGCQAREVGTFSEAVEKSSLVAVASARIR